MKRLAVLFVAALILCNTARAQSSPGDLVKALASEDAATRAAAFEGAARYGPPAIVAVAPLLDSDQFEVARSARIALEKIVGAATASEEQRAAASRALTVAVMSVKHRDWLLWLLSYAGGEESMEALLGLLDTAPEDFERTLMTLESLTRQRGPDGKTARLPQSSLADKLIERLPRLAEGQQVAVINTLGAIRAEAAIAPLGQLAATGGAVGAAALEALGRIGTPEAARTLLVSYEQTRDARVLDATLRVAEHLEAKAAGKLYAELLKMGPSEAQPEGLSALAAARCAALLGMGRTAGGTKAVRQVIPYLDSARADENGAARAALAAMPGDSVTTSLLKAARKATPARKSALLHVLAERDAATARPLLEAALDDENEDVTIAALTLLSAAPEPADAEKFLAAAKDGPEGGKAPALQGYLKLAAAMEDRAQALDMYHNALGLAQRDEERLAALEGLRVLADPSTLPHLEGLPALSPKLEVPVAELQLAIAATMESGDPDAARAIDRKVLADARPRKIAQAAAAALRRLGVTEDFARAAGFITDWQIIGPFAAKAFSQKFPPEEQPYDAKAVYAGAGDQQVSWRAWHTEDVLGITDLDDLYLPKEDVIAYARTVLSVPQVMDAVLKIGSDDGVVAWLNGQQIHKNNAQRRVRVDQDVVPITLQAGENVLLLKIVQGGSDWGYTVRLLNADGKPIL